MSLEDRLYPFLSVWQRLPRPFQRSVGRTYRRLPERVRFGSRFGEFRQLAQAVQEWSPEQIADYQLLQLRSVLQQAATTCPHYGRSFADAGFNWRSVTSLEDLDLCPQLTKRDLIEHRDELASTAVRSADRLFMSTGGSTGVPVPFYLQKGVSRPKEQAFLEAQWNRVGYSQAAKVAVIRGHVTSERSRGAIAEYDATRDWLMVSSYHLTEDRLAEYLDVLERFQPEFLHAYPSAALQLAQHLEASGRSWTVPLRAVLAGSERLTLPQKRILERAFGCRVFRWYGHSERVVLAAEGRASELFYFWPVYGFVEFGPPDAGGLREVIGTSFHNMAMPLIRYRTGDYVRLADPLDTGSSEFPWPAATAVEGREQEYLLSATGRQVSLTAMNMHDGIFDNLYAVQFFQAEAGRVEFRYVRGPQFHESQLRGIESGIRRKLGDDFEISIRRVDETDKTGQGKHRWLVSPLTEAASSTTLEDQGN